MHTQEIYFGHTYVFTKIQIVIDLQMSIIVLCMCTSYNIGIITFTNGGAVIEWKSKL